jgi:hypothetical protein
VSQDVEPLQKRLGNGWKLLTPTDLVEAGHQPVAVASGLSTARVVEDSARLEMSEVPEELFAVEIGERPDLVGIHLASTPMVHNCLED